jgi:hypothetical protein
LARGCGARERERERRDKEKATAADLFTHRARRPSRTVLNYALLSALVLAIVKIISPPIHSSDYSGDALTLRENKK